MALAKKGSRLISIDGVTYRWVVSPDSGYMVLVVETNDEPGQRLEAVFNYHYQQVELDSRFIQGRAISPGIVWQVIVTALERGWQPSTRFARSSRSEVFEGVECQHRRYFSVCQWTTASIDHHFECVLLDSPGLSRTPNVVAFSDYFTSHGVDDVAVFPNLGNDAILIVPCPVAMDSAYGHIAAFLRNAPEKQRDALWKSVGQTMTSRLSTQPVWLNTAGAGVAWLHVRLDSRPKYYGYITYKMPLQ
jgi:hypothetical protein